MKGGRIAVFEVATFAYLVERVREDEMGRRKVEMGKCRGGSREGVGTRKWGGGSEEEEVERRKLGGGSWEEKV